MKPIAIILALLVSGCACFDGDRGMKVATVALLGSSAFDAATTWSNVSGGAKELNPIARPFTSSPGALAGYTIATNAALVGASCLMKRHGIRGYKVPLWWGTAVHTGAGIWNKTR